MPWDELVERDDILILDTETTGRGAAASKRKLSRLPYVILYGGELGVTKF